MMSHTSGNILLHFIFSTAGRRPLIKPQFRNDLFAYLGGIVREMNGTALIVNGPNDHVHMLVRARPVHSPAEIVRVAKANSSRWVRENHSAGFGWQTGYGVFSVSESSVNAVTKYIAGQQEHHKKHSFQDEFVLFLKKNHVEYASGTFGISEQWSCRRGDSTRIVVTQRSMPSAISNWVGASGKFPENIFPLFEAG